MDETLVKVITFLATEAQIFEIRPLEILYLGGNDGLDFSLKQAMMKIEDKKIKIVSISKP